MNQYQLFEYPSFNKFKGFSCMIDQTIYHPQGGGGEVKHCKRVEELTQDKSIYMQSILIFFTLWVPHKAKLRVTFK